MLIRQFEETDNFVVDRAAIGQSGVERLQSLAALIAPQERQRFMKKLFNGDAVSFDRLVAQLETAPSWSAAHRVLEQYFYRRQMSPYSTPATRFSDLVYKRYFPQG
jgi:hypothetical protein